MGYNVPKAEADPMERKVRCLILACGNTLRSDDGIGPWLAEWAEERFAGNDSIRIIARQQWTPELAEDVAQADRVLFIDCSIESEPGSMKIAPIEPAAAKGGVATHHQGAPELLALSQQLFQASPHAMLLTIGAGSTELGETFSEVVLDAMPQACAALESTVLAWLNA
jgi:hydrogenase maturation protease